MHAPYMRSSGNAPGRGQFDIVLEDHHTRELLAKESRIRARQPHPSHATLLTTCGRCFTYGKGTALGLSKAERKSWELTEVSSFVGRKVLSVACGEYNTAFIVEA